jgi:hypothetical protein
MRMKRTTLMATACVAVLASGAAYWIDAREPPRRERWPKPTPPPPASNVFAESREPAPAGDEVERIARERPALLQREIENALAGADARRLETVFTFLLPELLQIEPARAAKMVASQEPGRKRDLLRDEVARQWIGKDPEAAMTWMKSLATEEERRAAAREAMEALAHYDPRLAQVLAERFDVRGRRAAVSAR